VLAGDNGCDEVDAIIVKCLWECRLDETESVGNVRQKCAKVELQIRGDAKPTLNESELNNRIAFEYGIIFFPTNLYLHCVHTAPC